MPMEVGGSTNQNLPWVSSSAVCCLSLNTLPAPHRRPRPSSQFYGILANNRCSGLEIGEEDLDLIWGFLDDDGGGDLDVEEMCTKLESLHKNIAEHEKKQVSACLSVSAH